VNRVTSVANSPAKRAAKNVTRISNASDGIRILCSWVGIFGTSSLFVPVVRGCLLLFHFSTPSEGAASVVFGDCETLSSLRPANACHPDRLVGGRLF